MPMKHAALVGTTAFLFVLGLGVGFAGTDIDVDQVAPVECGSLLSPNRTAAAFKYDVAFRGGGDELAQVYAERCAELRASRQVPTYSALGFGVVGLFATSLVFGRGNGPLTFS